jgi:hypothetical protein
MACHAGVTAFWTARQLAQRENSATPDTGWTAEDTSRKGVPCCRNFSTVREPQIWQAVTGTDADGGPFLRKERPSEFQRSTKAVSPRKPFDPNNNRAASVEAERAPTSAVVARQ